MNLYGNNLLSKARLSESNEANGFGKVEFFFHIGPDFAKLFYSSYPQGKKYILANCSLSVGNFIKI